MHNVQNSLVYRLWREQEFCDDLCRNPPPPGANLTEGNFLWANANFRMNLSATIKQVIKKVLQLAFLLL